MDRLEKYYLRILGKCITFPPNEGSTQLIKRILFRLIVMTGLYKKRDFPRGLQPYGGWTWWCITRSTAEYIEKFIKDRPDYIKFHKFSHVPDEMFFQTILLNSEDKNIRDSIVNKTLTYTKWIPQQPHPEILTMNNYEEIIKTDKLFARKFDIEIDSKVLELIDQEILTRTK